MKRMTVWFSVVLLLVGFAAGCSSDGSNTAPPVDILETKDLAAEDTAPEVEEDLPNFDGFDIPRLDNYEYVPQPGEFGYECNTNEECDSGFCVPTPDGAVCSRECVEDCPQGWLCVSGGTGPDIVYICVPRFLSLCNPCRTNQDCSPDEYEATTLDLCLDWDDTGKFCGADCSMNPDICTEGYICDEIQTPGGTFEQCVPEEGSCTCSQYAVQKELSTDCYVENDFGTCTGQRICDINGLTECDAATPGEERCDDKDNDCDGVVDEGCDDDDDGFCDANMQTVGEPSTCGSGGGDCNDSDPSVFPGATELCDNKDNNCDGIPDDGLCDDGDACTDDLCDPESGCSHVFNDADCDDGNECTDNDHCFEGSCQGAEKNCDDGNPCTDDLCNPLQEGGCYWVNNSNACDDDGNPCTIDVCENGTCQHKLASDLPCDDSNPCTDGDYCQSGVCVPGPPKECDDDDQCTDDSCDPAQGCVHEALLNQPCVYNFMICDINGFCGTNGCVPQPNCQIPNCSLGICCGVFQLCLDDIFSS